uniref:WASH complex subunit 3 n=1 Tax=Gadus morhua TaxID=8049 RepID=A0A8C5AID9_GADMO
MDEDGLPIVGSGVDLTKVPAIQQRRVVAHLNQFVVHTVRFLNRFSTVCEEVGPGHQPPGGESLITQPVEAMSYCLNVLSTETLQQLSKDTAD